MRTIYLIGNGTRDKKQLDYVKDKDTFSCNLAVFEWEKWGFLPTFWSTSEDPNYKNFLFDRLNDLKLWQVEYFGVRKILPDYAREKMDFPNTEYLPMVEYDEKDPGKEGAIIYRLGCTGATSAWMCLAHLGYDQLVLIGCNSHRKTIEECPVSLNKNHREMAKVYPKEFIKKTNNRHLRGWHRLKKWMEMKKPDAKVLNASLETEIDCFPRIQLGEE